MALTFSSMHALSLHMVVCKNAESKLMEKIREGKCEFPIGFKHYFVVQFFLGVIYYLQRRVFAV